MMVRPSRGGPVEPDKQKRVLIALGAVVAVLAIALGAVALTRDDGKGSTAATSSTSSSTTSASTTTSSTGPSTTTTLTPADLDLAVFPDLSRGKFGFDDPVALAKAFSLEILGFDDSALTGAFVGDSRSGAIAIRPSADADPTVVLVSKLPDGSWVVIGAHTDSIRLDTPPERSALTSPQPLVGAAQAFEGHVNVTLYADGQEVAIATTFVMGGGDAVLPFSGQLPFTVPKGTTRGVLVLSAASGRDGSTTAALAIRVKL
jgi:hypothetical protein